MFSKFKEIDWTPNKKAMHRFGRVLILGCPFAALAWYCLVRWFSGEWVLAVPIWIIGAGWAIALLAFSSRGLALPFYRLWFLIIAIIDTVITNTLLLILFYTLISIAALILKLFRYDPLHRRIEKDSVSYFEDSPKPKGPESYYNQF